MNDRKHQRLDLLCRLRGMHVEQARADHVAAQSELDEKREAADSTQQRIAELDTWAESQLTGGTPLPPEILRQAQLFRGHEKRTLEQQRAAEAESLERSESARDALRQKFEDLSVAERLAARHERETAHEQLRRGYVELDEAGVQSKLEGKE